MRLAVNVLSLLFPFTTFQLALSVAAASAQEEAPEPSRRLGADQWVPSLAVTSGVTIQEWEGESAATCSGCTNPAPVDQLRVPASGDDRDVTPFVGGQLELMTPELPIPLSPRFFAGGGVAPAFGTERAVADEGNVATLRSPLPPGSESTPFSEDAALGQGSEATAEMVDDWLYGAHAGIAFPLEFLGRSFRIKPSVGWIRFQIEAKGHVSDAECRSVPGNPPTNCNPLTMPPPPSATPGQLRSIQLRDKDTNTYDGIGGGLDVEMDVFRIGPIGSSLFIGAHAFKILGEREIEFGDSLTFADSGQPGLGAATAEARFRVDVDPVVYRLGLGLRAHWLGFDSK